MPVPCTVKSEPTQMVTAQMLGSCRAEGCHELCELQQSESLVQAWHDPIGAQQQSAQLGSPPPQQLLLLQVPAPPD